MPPPSGMAGVGTTVHDDPFHRCTRPPLGNPVRSSVVDPVAQQSSAVTQVRPATYPPAGAVAA